jgi:DNA modification methylase
LRVANRLAQTARRRTHRGRGICSLDQTPRSRKSRRPICFLEDALLDLTNCGDTVVDPFLSSGSTLLAAEKTERVCRGVEVDPLPTEST